MCKSSYLFHVKSWVQGKFQQHRIVHAPLAIYVVSAYETSNPHHSQILSQRRACNRVHGCTITNTIPLNIIEEIWFYVLCELLTCLEFESKNEGQLGTGGWRRFQTHVSPFAPNLYPTKFEREKAGIFCVFYTLLHKCSQKL